MHVPITFNKAYGQHSFKERVRLKCLLCSLVVRGLVLGKGEQLDRELARKGPLDDNAVVHLVVRRTAKVSYSAHGNEFELSISASDSAETVKR